MAISRASQSLALSQPVLIEDPVHEIDFSNYVRPPRIGATSGLVLTIRLIRAAPAQIPPHVQVALAGVHGAGSRVQDAVRGRQRRSISTRPADQRFDGAWAALHGRLVACTRLVGNPVAGRASALLSNLFPTGLEFLLLGYEAEWVHSRELLTRITEEGHANDLVELAGALFLNEANVAHKGLGEALGLDGVQKVEPSLMVGEEILALANAIATYGRLFAGTVVDEATLAVFRTAMAPLDAYRESNRRSGSGEGEDAGENVDETEGVDIDEPLPPVPGGG
jgi:hypothetical protein